MTIGRNIQKSLEFSCFSFHVGLLFINFSSFKLDPEYYILPKIAGTVASWFKNKKRHFQMAVETPFHFYVDMYYVALSSGCIKCCTPAVRPCVPCLRFSRNRKAVETSNFYSSRATFLT